MKSEAFDLFGEKSSAAIRLELLVGLCLVLRTTTPRQLKNPKKLPRCSDPKVGECLVLVAEL